MGLAHTFPITFDYGQGFGRDASGIAAFTATGGERTLRHVRPAARTFHGVAQRRPQSDRVAVESFYVATAADYFLYVDEDGRHYACEWVGAPQFQWAGYEQVDIACDFREAAGKALDVYPSTPLVELPLDWVDVGDGKVLWYSGHGYKLTASGVSGVELDGVSAPSTEKYDVPLGAHVFKVLPAGAAVTKLEVVP